VCSLLPFLLKESPSENSHRFYEKLNFFAKQGPSRRGYLHYESCDPRINVSFCHYGAQSGSPGRRKSRPLTITATDTSALELTVLDKKNDDGVKSDVSDLTSSSHDESSRL
jgi:hypothetical protein